MKSWTRICNDSYYLGYDDGYKEGYADAVKELKLQWIPCSERSPERKGEYLVTYRPCYWDNVENEIKVGIDSFRGKTSWAKKKHQLVIAWREMPEPYQPEEKSE